MHANHCLHAEGFLLISGDDLLTKPILSIGGAGVISVLANALPATFKTLIEGDSKTSLEAAYSLLELNSLMYQEGNPVGLKISCCNKESLPPTK